MGFASDLNKICKRAGDKAEQVVRKTAIELMNSMILKSPVDTGRFRANWQCGIGTANYVATAPVGTDAEGKTREVMVGWEPGQTIWLTNALPYSLRLENGYSKQAPYGMVRLTVQEYGEYLKKAARSIK